MCKVTLKFICDMLYIKGEITFEMYEDVMCTEEPKDLDKIIDKLIRGAYDGSQGKNRTIEKRTEIIEICRT